VESSSGLRSVLARPSVYELWSRLVGGERSRAALVREYVRPFAGERVLDLGCGPGDLVRHLGDVRYVGVDVSEAYIERAMRLYGDRAEFRVGDATRLDDDLRGFDLVLAFGVVHHLDDEGARAFWSGAAEALTPEGRAVGVDPTFATGQPRLARLVISADRGQRVRSPEEYVCLARRSFRQVRSAVRSDLLRIPYTHCVIDAER
jgi:SAM-dependent methyltransferase